MRSRQGFRTVFYLVSMLCLVFGAVGDVPLVASVGTSLSSHTEPMHPQSIQLASWRDVGAMVPAPQSSDPAGGAGHVIHLKSRQFVPSSINALALDEAASLGEGRAHVLMQLDYIPRQAAKEALRAQGIELLAYVPDYAWIAALPAVNAASTLDLPGVTWIGELAVDDKLDPDIREGRWGEHNLAPDGTAAVYVVMHGDETLDTGRALVETHGGTVVAQVVGIRMLVVEMPRDNVRALAAEGAVQWIEPAGLPLTPANDGSRAQIGVDVVNAAPYNLDGTGIDVLIYDGGRVGDHVDFGTRLDHGDTASFSEHATHVAGIVGGSGANSTSEGGSALQWRGMAPAVDLISYGIEDSGSGVAFYDYVFDIEYDWAAAQNTWGADLGTASLSSNIYANYPSRCDLMGNYGVSAVLIDQIVRGGNSTVGTGDRYIATWNVGNERGSPSSCGTYGTISPPASAKNPIHVGGSNTDDNTMFDYGSWGPTDDGRIKPIVVAGASQNGGDTGIMSTDNNPADTYSIMSGTSMATPAVAGGIALMLQHYRDVYGTSGNFWPSTAKAILMQTAEDFGRAGPDYEWGYGQVDIHAAVDLISRKAFRQENVDEDEVDLYSFIVPDDNNPLSVSLAWDDYEATFNASSALINNLDLELVAPSGVVWRPWVLNPASPTSVATRGVDSLNNQEQVQVSDPEIGTWMVRVKGTTVPQGPQGYTLVCEGCKPLDVGACQGTLDGTAAAAMAMSAADGSEEQTLVRLPRELSEGERWQRALEAGTLSQEATVSLITEDGEVVYAIPGPAASRPQGADAVFDAMSALDVAAAQGPEAIRSFAETLSPRMLDILNDEIAEVMERLAERAPPRPDSGPTGEAEEGAVVEAQQALDAANRARALASGDDPAEGAAEAEPLAPPALPAQGVGPAADRTVGSGCTYATLAAAIAAADPGDRLLIEGGVTFAENLVIDRSLTLRGGYAGCASGSSARTTIDGGGGGRVIEIAAGLDVTLVSLNLTNGATGFHGGGIRVTPPGGNAGTLNLDNVDVYENQADWGGGIWVGENAQVIGSDVEVYSNTATTYGGGVRLYGGRMTLEDSNIQNNSAPEGGGVYGSLVSTYAPELDLPSNADVLNNQALSGGGLGGGVYMREGTVSLADRSDIYSNDAVDGGGVYLVTSTLTIDGYESEIHYNTATGSGGGVYAQGSTVNLDDDAELFYNDASTTGGGAYLNDSVLRSDRSGIRYNSAGTHGGGVYATNGSTVDMDLGSYVCLGVRCSQLYGNQALSLYGGGIFASGSSVSLDNTFVENNGADRGGGVYATGSSVEADNTLFARNVASNVDDDPGDGVRLYSGATLSGEGNTFAYNDSGGAATGMAIAVYGTSDVTLSCSIVWGHDTSIDSTTATVSYSDIEGGYTGTVNLDVNPLFVSAVSQDYHLQSTSPVIDRCLDGSGTDFDNEVRPIVRSTAASPYDMGADEAAGVDRVGVNGTCTYGTVQQAVNAAEDGDTIRVSAGVYFENVNTSGKSITIEGGYDSTCATVTGGETRVEGSAGSGSTFDVGGGTVVLRGLQIAWGSDTGGGVDVRSGAQVTLEDSDVLHNHGTYGGGIYVDIDSVVTISSDSDVRDNTASAEGGGARVWGALYGADTSSDIYHNCAPHGGGISVPGGTLVLDDNDVYGNQAAHATGQGGGIHVTSGGVVTLSGNAYVFNGNLAYDGGGIHADASTVYLLGDTTTVRDNEATNCGGGAYLSNGSTLYASGARVGYAAPGYGNEAQYGGGIYALNSTVEFSGDIVNNLAADRGAGIYADASVLTLTGVQVGGTGSYEANSLAPSGHEGVGLYLANGTQATLENTVVSSNTFQTTGHTYGGGAYVGGGSVLTLTNSTVERHLAPSIGDGRGAGIYVDNSTAILDGSHVINNTAGTVGGGIRMFGTSTLVVAGGSTVGYNESLTGEGGGIAARDTADIDIVDAVLSYNTAATDGGAIYVIDGALDVNRVILHHNSAQRGGAIYGEGSASANVRNTLIYANTAGGALGAGIYAGGGTVVLTHVTLAGNLNGAGYTQSGTTSSVYNSIAWGNAGGGFIGPFAGASCNIDQSGIAGSSVDPLFVGGGDYHLTSGSPAVDACGSGTSSDLDGVPRPFGSDYDMGAYEYVLHYLYLPIVQRSW